MKRSFNYTGRKRIALSDAVVAISGTGRNATFDVTLNLGKYKFPVHSKVFVEAYRQMDWMRFDFGLAGGVQAPIDRRLDRFDSVDGVLFRVRVVSPDGTPSGKLVAEADRISARLPGTKTARRNLLPLVPASLEGELFRLDLTSESQPILLVERELGGDWQSAAASPLFESLVYPQVLRGVLTELMKDGWSEGDWDPGTWQADWARLVRSLPGFTEPPVDETELGNWIDTVVEAFCRTHRMCERFNKVWSGGVS
jgi:hypothetical protein